MNHYHEPLPRQFLLPFDRHSLDLNRDLVRTIPLADARRRSVATMHRAALSAWELADAADAADEPDDPRAA